MIALKKVYGDELLRLALVLSLLRSDPNGYFAHEALQLTAGGLDASNGTWSAEHEPRAFTRPRFIHPKSPDNNLLEYEREVFAELNSLGGLRYAGVYGDLETYCVNNFVECRAAQVLQANVDNAPDGQDSSPNFGVSDDDNVAGEVHLANADDPASEAENIKEPNEESVKTESNNDTRDGKDLYDESAETSPPVKQEIEPIPDVVTVTNVTDSSDLFDRLSLDVKEFDVSDFFATPSNMHIKKEEHTNGVRVKVENEDLFETANNHFLPHYFERIKKYGEEEDVFDQNLSDLRDYAETVESLDDFRRGFERLDVKERGREDLERYLLDNTRIELDKYGGFAFELGVKRERASTSFTSVSPGGASETADLQGECDDGLCVGGEELTQEDMDLIEVLWKQDVDMGFSLDTPLVSNPVEDLKESSESVKPYVEHRDVPKGFKCGPESTACADPTETSLIPTTVNDDLTPAKQEPAPVDDPWAGFSYIIDTETGEYIIQGELPPSLVSDSSTDADRFDLLEEALQLVGLEEPSAGEGTAGAVEGAVDGDDDKQKQHPEAVKSELGEDRGAVMLHPGVGARPPHHPPHHHSHHPLHQHYHHQSIVRQMSMEQRWQDLASLLAITPPDSQHHLNHPHHLGHLNHAHQAYHPHHPHHGHHHAYAPVNHHPYAPQHGAAPPPHLPPSSGPYSNAYGSTLSVASPADKSDIYGPSLVEHQPPQAIAPAAGSYKTPATGGGGPNGPQHHEVAPATHPHDGAMYYQNSTSDINGTSDGFLSSILNDEDLQLMDMAVNEGMYTMRMLDGSGSQQLQSGVGAAGTAAPAPHAPHLHQYAPPHHGFANLAPNMAQAVAGATPVGATHLSMGNERMDSSSDSAVSSMGSERVPSLSDGEWCDGGSDSAQEYHSSKFRPYSSYGRTGPDGHPVSSAPASQAPPQRHHTPPVAQKKHHMFGKRCFQEQNSPILDPVAEMPRPREEVKYEYEPSHLTYGPPAQDIGGIAMPPELKYSCTLEFAATSRPGALVPNLPSLGVTHTERARIAHNHTYGAPPEHAGGPPLRPQARDKRTRRLTDGSDCSGSGSGSSASHLSRDEKRAKALGIPLAVQEIINLPMDEFNERLSKHDLSEAQLSLIRDIRRRGKNKVAAQNCRKRKLEQITSLEDEVRNVRDRKTRLQRERISLTAERQRVKDCFTMLYHHVFQHLRDTEGNPLSSHQYSLQQAADGAVVLVPRSQQGVPQSGAHSMHGAPHMLRQSGEDDRHGMNRTSEDEMDRYKPKHQRKSFDQ